MRFEDFSWHGLVHLIVVLFDNVIAKYLFLGLVILVFSILAIKNKTKGKSSPSMPEAEIASNKVVLFLQRTLLVGGIGFILVQLFRVFVL